MTSSEEESAELAGLLRETINAYTTNATTDEQVREATVLARRLVETLAGEPRDLAWQPPFGSPETGMRFFSPVSGPGNPGSPPISFLDERDGDGIAATATIDRRFGGPPGFVHGGVTALIIDELVGQAARRAGHWGMTASLTLTYHRALPLGEPLLFRGRVVSTEGRKTRVAASVAMAGEPDVLHVTVEALMIRPKPTTHERYFGGQAPRSDRAF